MIRAGVLYRVVDGSGHAFPVGDVITAEILEDEEGFWGIFTHPKRPYHQSLAHHQVEEYIITLENK